LPTTSLKLGTSELHSLGVDLFLHQQGLDTTTPAGKAMFQMMGVFAEFERAMIQERVRAGLRRARDEGKQLGRPKIAADVEIAIQAALRRKDRPGVRESLPRMASASTRCSASRTRDDRAIFVTEKQHQTNFLRVRHMLHNLPPYFLTRWTDEDRMVRCIEASIGGSFWGAQSYSFSVLL
jgi:Resolvase, N terminal domain